MNPLAQAMAGLGGRRFLLAVGSSALTTLLQWNAKLDPGGTAYTTVILGTVGAYIAGNVIQKRAEIKAQEPAP